MELPNLFKNPCKLCNVIIQQQNSNTTLSTLNAIFDYFENNIRTVFTYTHHNHYLQQNNVRKFIPSNTHSNESMYNEYDYIQMKHNTQTLTYKHSLINLS